MCSLLFRLFYFLNGLVGSSLAYHAIAACTARARGLPSTQASTADKIWPLGQRMLRTALLARADIAMRPGLHQARPMRFQLVFVLQMRLRTGRTGGKD